MYGKSVKTGSYINRTYRIDAQLGSGGSGAVYMAWHTRLKKHVVIKIIKDSYAGAVEIHRNEVEALKNVKSLFIPQVFDFLTESKNSFTIMEYIEGESFDKLLEQGLCFTEQQINKWYIQLASALAAIHKCDVCHRDIKPSNIMLTKNGDACLIDFNSAFVSGNRTGVVSRSMGYASPEQYEYFRVCKDAYSGILPDLNETSLVAGDCRTEPVMRKKSSAYSGVLHFNRNGVYEIDWKLSDIYSLGATMCHFLTGKRPPVKTIDIEKISELEGYSTNILKIIRKSMNTFPDDRFASAEELEAALTQ